MKTLAFVNQKGGVGKTTSTINIARTMVKKFDLKVLVVDFDPQANTTIGLGVEPDKIEYTVYDLMKDKYLSTKTNINPNDIIKTKYGIDVLPNSISMAKIEIELGGVPQRNHMLKKVLSHPDITEKNYDYVLIDCQPSLSVATFNALIAADKVFVPIQSGFFSLAGLTELMDTIDMIKDLNPSLSIGGIFMSIVQDRTVLYKRFKSELQDFLPDQLMESYIRKNEAVRRASANGQPILDYDKTSNGAKDFVSLTQEILDQKF